MGHTNIVYTIGVFFVLIIEKIPPFILILLLPACDNNLRFNKTQHQLVQSYKNGDTIYFQSEKNDIDTLLILSVDSTEKGGGFLSGAPEKSLTVSISHLPIDHWISSYNCCPNRPIPNDLITIVISNDQPDYYYVRYRGFRHEFEIDSLKTHSIRIGNREIKNYWRISNSDGQNIQRPENTSEIIWTQSHGLTMYRKESGDWYYLSKSPVHKK